MRGMRRSYPFVADDGLADRGPYSQFIGLALLLVCLALAGVSLLSYQDAVRDTTVYAKVPTAVVPARVVSKTTGADHQQIVYGLNLAPADGHPASYVQVSGALFERAQVGDKVFCSYWRNTLARVRVDGISVETANSPSIQQDAFIGEFVLALVGAIGAVMRLLTLRSRRLIW
jgi:hypothetical protein